jgi:excisionase family DNA binding protein
MSMSLITSDHNMLTVGEIADMFRVSHMTIYRLIDAGELRAVQMGRSYRVPREALRKYIEDHPGTVAA